MDNATQWHQLIAVLETEVRHYTALKDLIEEESEILMRSDQTAFNQMLSAKQALVEKLQDCEAERSAWLSARGYSAGKAHLKALIALAPEKVSERLEYCRRELTRLTRALERRNHINKKMLHHSRRIADNALQLLGNQLYVQPTYQSNGNLAGAGNGGVLLSGLA